MARARTFLRRFCRVFGKNFDMAMKTRGVRGQESLVLIVIHFQEAS
jgi:hypothetical protein